MSRTLIPVLCSLLVGCATPVTLLTPYQELPGVTFMTSTSKWVVYDRPTVGRAMVKPDAANMVRLVLVAGLSLGSFGTELRKPIPEGVLEEWLVAEGRSCHITDGYPIATYQWEFRYTCS